MAISFEEMAASAYQEGTAWLAEEMGIAEEDPVRRLLVPQKEEAR